VRAPDEAASGIAKVMISFDDWKDGRVLPITREMRVIEDEPRKSLAP
jgi:hypothetical protein